MPVTENDIATPSRGPTMPARVWIGLPHWLLGGAGLVLVGLAGPLATVFDSLLPGRATLRSLGTNYGSLGDLGPDLIARIGLTLLATMVGSIFYQLVPRPLTRRASLVAVALVAVVTATWFAWLSMPHNAYPTNARIHWVDYLTWDTEDYFYAAGRIPRAIFYEIPWLWQAINASLLVMLSYLTARRMQIGAPAAALLSTAVAVSGNILTFADTSEDVLLNLLLIMLFLYASLRRIGWFTGLALALLVLGRPSFAIIALAIPLAEAIVALRFRHRPSLEQIRYTASAAVVAATGIFISQLYFTLSGRRYFLNQGQLIYVPELDDLTPIEVDGFTLTALSGAYVGHLVWVFPVVFLVGTGFAVWLAKRQPTEAGTTVYVAAISAGLLVAMLELRPILYYNVRYLTYAFPFLVVATWSLLAPGVVRTRPHSWFGPPRAARSLLVCLIAFAPMAVPASPIEVKQSLASRPEPELLSRRDELRRLADDRIVYLDYGGRSSRNYLSYVLRRNRSEVRPLGESDPAPGSLVISRRSDPWSDDSPLLQTDSLLVFEVEPTTTP